MTRGLGGHSPANVTHHLKGIHFPAQKRDLVQQAKANHATREVMAVVAAMLGREFASIADVMKASGKADRGAER